MELTHQDQVRLAPLRAAIRGWPYSENRTHYLRKGEKELSLLPGRLQSEGDRIINPLRSAVRNQLPPGAVG